MGRLFRRVMSIQQVAALHEVGLLQVIPVARGGRLGSAVHTTKYRFNCPVLNSFFQYKNLLTMF